MLLINLVVNVIATYLQPDVYKTFNLKIELEVAAWHTSKQKLPRNLSERRPKS